jgi:hypothetical protein
MISGIQIHAIARQMLERHGSAAIAHAARDNHRSATRKSNVDRISWIEVFGFKPKKE